MQILLRIIVLLPLICSCKKGEEPRLQPKEIKLTTQQVQIVDGANHFGMDLFREINMNETATQNVFISPLSIHLALGMAWNGANGNTKQQMAHTMYFPDFNEGDVNQSYKSLIFELLDADSKVAMSIANSIWYRNTFSVRSSFLEINRNYFDAQVSALNFDDPESKSIINKWVATKTKNRIKGIVDEIQPDHVMFLINAIYFKGMWQTSFKKSESQNRTFYLADGSQKQAMTMHTTASFPVITRPAYRVIELPHGRGNFSMLVFLPNVYVPVNEIIENMTAEEWNEVTALLNNAVEVNLQLPQFGFEYEKDLNQALQTLGIEDAFDDVRANFKGISEEQIYISRVKHKTFVEVNEEGTEAAAVTSIEMRTTTSLPSQPITFHVNRPFVFALKEKYTNSLMFIGKVMDPGNK